MSSGRTARSGLVARARRNASETWRSLMKMAAAAAPMVILLTRKCSLDAQSAAARDAAQVCARHAPALSAPDAVRPLEPARAASAETPARAAHPRARRRD